MEADLHSCCLEESNASYANFTKANLKDVQWKQSILKEASFEEVKWKGNTFEQSDLRNVQFFRTSLDQIDFTTSQIEGIVVDRKDLKGAIVNIEQAIDLSKLLEIQIK